MKDPKPAVQQEEFQPKGFDWKREIWCMSKRLITVEVHLEDHLRAHDRKLTWLYGILGTVIGGLVVGTLSFFLFT